MTCFHGGSHPVQLTHAPPFPPSRSLRYSPCAVLGAVAGCRAGHQAGRVHAVAERGALLPLFGCLPCSFAVAWSCSLAGCVPTARKSRAGLELPWRLEHFSSGPPCSTSLSGEFHGTREAPRGWLGCLPFNLQGAPDMLSGCPDLRRRKHAYTLGMARSGYIQIDTATTPLNHVAAQPAPDYASP